MNSSSQPISGARRNQLLMNLPDTEWSRWKENLQLVDLSFGQILCETGRATPYAIFPTTAIVSMQYMTQEGATPEIAVVGNDGVVDISLLMGGTVMPSQAIVQAAGQAYRLPAQILRNYCHCGGPILNMLLRYTQALIAQVAQTAMCNRYHTIEQQLCRRLLLGLDRLPSNTLLMTQEVVAKLLGVRRESVTIAALKLQHDGLICYRRGRIDVLNREGLERRACDCYKCLTNIYERLLPMPLAA